MARSSQMGTQLATPSMTTQEALRASGIFSECGSGREGFRNGNLIDADNQQGGPAQVKGHDNIRQRGIRSRLTPMSAMVLETFQVSGAI